jgi:hypothetical protein
VRGGGVEGLGVSGAGCWGYVVVGHTCGLFGSLRTVLW